MRDRNWNATPFRFGAQLKCGELCNQTEKKSANRKATQAVRTTTASIQTNRSQHDRTNVNRVFLGVRQRNECHTNRFTPKLELHMYQKRISIFFHRLGTHHTHTNAFCFPSNTSWFRPPFHLALILMVVQGRPYAPKWIQFLLRCCLWNAFGVVGTPCSWYCWYYLIFSQIISFIHNAQFLFKTIGPIVFIAHPQIIRFDRN